MILKHMPEPRGAGFGGANAYEIDFKRRLHYLLGEGVLNEERKVKSEKSIMKGKRKLK